MSLIRISAAALAALTIALPARAQTSDRDAIIATVQKLFDGMRTRDSAMIVSAFDTSARFVGVTARGTPAVSLLSPARFAAAVKGAPADRIWNERMYDPEVRIDGNIAQVWTYYTFHLNDTFSHCGIDAFMLLKVGDTWRITQLADTERPTGCNPNGKP